MVYLASASGFFYKSTTHCAADVCMLSSETSTVKMPLSIVMAVKDAVGLTEPAGVASYPTARNAFCELSRSDMTSSYVPAGSVSGCARHLKYVVLTADEGKSYQYVGKVNERNAAAVRNCKLRQRQRSRVDVLSTTVSRLRETIRLCSPPCTPCRLRAPLQRQLLSRSPRPQLRHEIAAIC